MGQRADGKYGGPDGVNEVNYGEKTSQYGHYAPSDFGHAGMNAEGTKWKSQNMEWIEDDRTFEAPAAAPPEEAKPEPLPEHVKETIPSPQARKAQDLVDSYTANITGGNSIYNTGIQSPTPNLNTQTPIADAAVESNTYIDPDYSVNNPEKKAAEAFLDAKKIQFGSGLKL